MKSGASKLENRRGILLLVAACGFFAINDVSTKALTLSYPPGEVLFLRSVVALACLGALAAAMRGTVHARGVIRPVVLLRASLEGLSHVAFILAMAHMAIAELSALTLSSPLLLIIILVLFFAERIGWRRWMAIVFGLAGALLIVKPSSESFNVWAVVGLAVALTAALRELATRYIGQGVSNLAVTILSLCAVTLGGLALGLAETWIVVPWHDLGLFCLAGVALSAGTYLGIAAFREGDISVVAPFRYTTLVWVTVGGYLFLNEAPDLPSIAGGLMIVASGVYAFHREIVTRRVAEPE